MRSELEIRRELKRIEALMEGTIANRSSYEVAYGAYRALNWVVGERISASSASHALEMMEAWAVHRAQQDVAQTMAGGVYSDSNEGALP